MLTIAHRGDHSEAPENSMLAFRRAVNAGATWIELDVFQCKTGELMIMHDDALERTTTGTGTISESTRDMLNTIFLKDKNEVVTSEKIPSLEDVLLQFPTAHICIELKGNGTAQPVADLLQKYNRTNVLVSSFKKTEVQASRQCMSQILTAVTLWGKPSNEELDLYASWGVGMIHIDWNDGDLDKALCDAAHARGLAVWVYTVNTPDLAKTLQQYGVDAIFTDSYSTIAPVVQ